MTKGVRPRHDLPGERLWGWPQEPLEDLLTEIAKGEAMLSFTVEYHKRVLVARQEDWFIHLEIWGSDVDEVRYAVDIEEVSEPQIDASTGRREYGGLWLGHHADEAGTKIPLIGVKLYLMPEQIQVIASGLTSGSCDAQAWFNISTTYAGRKGVAKLLEDFSAEGNSPHASITHVSFGAQGGSNPSLEGLWTS